MATKMTSHCAGTVQMREETESGIRKWKEMWFKTTAEDRQGAAVTCDGRLFHRRATGNALSPTVDRRVRRISRDVDEAESWYSWTSIVKPPIIYRRKLAPSASNRTKQWAATKPNTCLRVSYEPPRSREGQSVNWLALYGSVYNLHVLKNKGSSALMSDHLGYQTFTPSLHLHEKSMYTWRGRGIRSKCHDIRWQQIWRYK